MKTSSFLLINILFFIVLNLSPRIQVNSQAAATDSCASSFDLGRQLLFKTTSLICRSVWDAQGFILRYEETSPKLWSFILSAPNTNSYIGMGFSSNGKMVGSSAIVGWRGADGGSMIKRYHLTGQKPKQVVPDQGNLQVVGTSSSLISLSGRLYITFQLNTSLPDNRILYSVGPAGRLPVRPGFQLAEHDQKVSTILDYASGESKTKGSSSSTLKKIHGILNMSGWGIILPIGAMVARYMKPWDPVWFYSHSLVQSLGFLFGVSGIICGFVLENRLGVDVDKHKSLGVIILTLGCLQVIAFLVRPEKESKVRKYWNWYHYSLGRVLIILAVANVFYGIHLGDAGSVWKASYAVVVCLLFVVAFILELRLWIRH
ncbi:Cytochrome b561 and DOMON domain-containing protein [Heracleum sosnowskyi]|uniref:Cytochrome b561 and DOMON domain-containing protein n=1 Tax=Heracleum sosnowskyi TaxID=360622 RepID=A0AAD8LZD8_9APIA|nr:Cytochrome b561 and DOMON domain-containing protein [Heracleum sosnowskyi]